MNHYSAAKRFGINEENIINIDGKIIHEKMNKHKTNRMFGAYIVTTEAVTRKIANIAAKKHNLNETDAMTLAHDRMNSVMKTKRINKIIFFVTIYWIQS